MFDPQKSISRFLYDSPSMTDEEKQQLSGWIKQDAEHAKQFIRSALFHRGIHDVLVGSDSVNDEIIRDNYNASLSDSAFFEKELWKRLAQIEETAEPVEMEEKKTKKKPAKPLGRIHKQPIQRKINRFSLFTAAAAMAALLFFIVYAHLQPLTTQEDVAIVADALQAECELGGVLLVPGDRLLTYQGPIQLTEGIIKITYDTGVDVTLQSPAEFEILAANEIGLRYGKLYAKVPESGKGYTVQTRNSRIIDLGTEFGVFADLRGECEVHVFKGQVNLLTGTETRPVDETLNQRQACRIDETSQIVQSIPFQEQLFVQDIVPAPSQDAAVEESRRVVNLASIVAGGDGQSAGNTRRGINPESGKVSRQALRFKRRNGDNSYSRTPSLKYIDGVFTPHDDKGRFQVSSAGHKFRGFHDTAVLFWSDITTDLRVPQGTSGMISGRYLSRAEQEGFFPILDGKMYGKASQPDAIFIAPNAGITFDLNQIRKDVPELAIRRFKAVCGLAENTKNIGEPVYFWVLLDGKKVLKHIADPADLEVCQIEIPIEPSQRFLTLATSIKGAGIAYNWALFAGPILE